MAIKKQFGGATISKPGVYSRTQTSPDGSSQSAVTGVILLIGEADAGPGGATEGIQTYSAAALNQLKAKYRSGSLVDAAKAASAPSRTPGVNGAGTYLIWKTNASIQASLALASSYGTVKAKEYGVGGNRITYKNTLSSETAAKISGSAVVTAFGALDTQTLVLRVNGASAVTVTFATPANMADVLSQINAVTTTSISATSDAGKLVLTQGAAANHHRDGYSRSVEVVSGSALGNLFLTAQIAVPAAEPQASIELIQPRDSITETVVVGGQVALTLGRDTTGSATAATVTVSPTDITLSQTGATPTSYVLTFANYPLIGGLVDAINELPGWTAACPASVRSEPCATLDKVSAVGALSNLGSPARIKRDANAVAERFADSVLADISAQVTKGLPDAEGRLNLTNGARGGSSPSDFDAGLSAALAQDLNVILPCISQDASADITAGLTDASSTYDVETVHAMLDTALRLRGSIKNRKEAQGFVGYRKQAKADVFQQAALLGSELIQLCMEDVLVVDSSNSLTWKQPHIEAALMAGIRMGTEVGEPRTHKFLNCQGVGHFVNAATGVAQGDYNPQLDYEQAIAAGVTSAEPASGSFWVMIDNTTYGADESFVFNRGSVMEAAQYIAKTIRSDAESAFIGRKTSVVTAESIKNRIRSKLVELFKGRITSASDDAPQGFVEDTFVVTVVGNTAEVQVEVKPVQGMDFIFINFTLGETRQSA